MQCNSIFPYFYVGTFKYAKVIILQKFLKKKYTIFGFLILVAIYSIILLQYGYKIRYGELQYIISMLDSYYNHFGINSKFKIPKKYGFVQNMSFRELQKQSKKKIQRIFCNAWSSLTIKKIHQMKDEIKCNKTLYIFIQFFYT